MFYDNENMDNDDNLLRPDEIWQDSSMNTSAIIPDNNKSRKNKKRRIIITLLICIAVTVTGLVISTRILWGKGWLKNAIIKSSNNTVINIPIQNKPKLDTKYYDSKTGLYTPQGIAKRVMPSVVSVLMNDKANPLNTISQGSGIIMTDNGYIITNAHVVSDKDKTIKVVLNNNDEYDAVLVGMDEKTDLAVIKINAKNLSAADFGNSDELEIGEDIIALGSPGGLYSSLTRGVVSGLDRMIKTEASSVEMNYIQIDAAINPGNSGGALVNMYGQVVGINSAKLKSETYDGIGFAISMNAAKPIIEKLIADGYVKDRYRIGIIFVQVTEGTSKDLGIVPGLWVKEIDKDCDIANSGLKISDIITKVEGVPVIYKTDVDQALKGKKPGDKINATVSRINDKGDFDSFEITFKLMEDNSMKIDSSSDK